MKTGIKLSEVLHLYLGCECEYEWNREPETVLIGVITTSIIGSIRSDDGVIHWVKPILRELSDMLPEERNQIEEILGCLNADHFVNAWTHNTPYAISIHQMVELTNTLRKNGFDMDGLIPSGQAINKNSLNK